MATQNNKKIIYVTSEVVPFSKTGGLADATGELAHAVADRGNEVMVISPMFSSVKQSAAKLGLSLEKISDVDVPFDGGKETVGVYRAKRPGDNVTYVFVDHEDFAKINAGGYDDGNIKRFAMFSCSVPEVAVAAGMPKPDVIHAHDWHAGYVPALLKHSKDLPVVTDEQGQSAPFGKGAISVFTIHNAGYTGQALLADVLRWTGLPNGLTQFPLNSNGYANAMTAGAGFADVVTTVSPTHAYELRNRLSASDISVGKLYPIKGIVNGITEEWDPSSAHPDHQFHPRFSANNMAGKLSTKRDLCEKFKLSTNRPLMGLVSRLTSDQKGIDVFADSIDGLVAQGWNVIVAGDGEPALKHQLHKKAEKYPGQVVFLEGYSGAEQTHQIIAGSDAFAIPSRYEPCGITQMQAMASGTLPIATRTGGLKDTIIDPYDKVVRDKGVKPTGFLFSPVMTSSGPSIQSEDFLEAAKRAYRTYTTQRSAWEQMQKTAMGKLKRKDTAKEDAQKPKAGLQEIEDFSWATSAEKYDDLYDARLGLNKSSALEREKSSSMAQKLLNLKRKDYPHTNHVKALACYNLFPRNYDSLGAMKDDIDRVASMGFNAVWINPLCEVGEVAQPDWEKFQVTRKSDGKGKGRLPDAKPGSGKIRSLYATFDPFSINHEFADDKSDPYNEDKKLASLKALTGTIAFKGMTPMCDVAFSHMAVDSDCIKKGWFTLPDGRQIETSHWFKRYTEGSLKGEVVRQGVDCDGYIDEHPEHAGKPHSKMVWADVAVFNYEDPEIREEIIEFLWKPYMDYLVNAGFTGMRVDSIAQNHPEVLDSVLGYFKQKVHEKHPSILPQDVIILGETLGQDVSEYREKTREITHTYCSSYWMATNGVVSDGTKKVSDGKEIPKSGPKECQILWARQHETGKNGQTEEMGRLHEAVSTLPTGTDYRPAKRDPVGGPVGNAGSHDEANIVESFVDPNHTVSKVAFNAPGNAKSFLDFENKKIIAPGDPKGMIKGDPLHFFDIENAEAAMREKMAQTMLVAPGGHFLFGGDEFLQVGPRSVFSDHEKALVIKADDGKPRVDLSDYIRDINRILKKLSPPQKGFWATRRCQSRTDLVVMERHPSHGFNGVTDVIIMNTTPGNEPLRLSEADLQEIASEITIEKRKPHHSQAEPLGTHPSAQELASALLSGRRKGESDQPHRLRVHCDSRIQLDRTVEASLGQSGHGRVVGMAK